MLREQSKYIKENIFAADIKYCAGSFSVKSETQLPEQEDQSHPPQSSHPDNVYGDVGEEFNKCLQNIMHRFGARTKSLPCTL